jgi:hypothetical protein
MSVKNAQRMLRSYEIEQMFNEVPQNSFRVLAFKGSALR